jgi:AcrR family transcriptional regulator
MATVPPEQLSRRRQETRARLLDAAFRVFAAEGFGRATVERICEAADYTRGAFYSNFTSLDELFLAMWEERTVRMVGDLQRALDRPTDDSQTTEEMLAVVLSAVPVNADWYRVSLEFNAHALRNPGLRRAVAAREAGIADALLPSLEVALARAGRRVTDRTALGQALIAVHDGTLAQCLLEPDDASVWERRNQLFLNVLFSYTEERPR